MKEHIAIAGAGFAGAVLARELAESGRFRVTVFEERLHVAGNCHTERDDETGIMVHKFGPHVFTTDSEEVWKYVNYWGKFEPFVNRVKANTAKGIFPIPINLLTINQFYQKKLTPAEAKDFVGSLGESRIKEPLNFEEAALQLMGVELYQNFYQGLAKKQWGVEPRELPTTLINSSAIRFNYNDNYYDRKFQGIPISGYTEIIKRILDHHQIELRLGTKLEPERKRDFDHVFWSGPLDGFFNYRLGRLSYRTLEFERFIDNDDFQGNPVITYCEEEVPYLRVTEHKHFTPWEKHDRTVIYKEYPKNCGPNDIPYYPMRLKPDKDLLKKYLQLIEEEPRITFIGRLGTYRYVEMNHSIKESLELARICKMAELNDWPKFSVYPL